MPTFAPEIPSCAPGRASASFPPGTGRRYDPSMLAALSWLWLACQERPDAAPAPSPLVFEFQEEAFGAGNVTWNGDAFTLLANDADLDGDPDLFVNWHVFAAPALWWNRGGRFQLDAGHPWSLPEHDAAPMVDAKRRDMQQAVEARERAGITLWHSDKGTFWNLAFTGIPADVGADARLRIETNRPILEVTLKAEEYELEADEAGARRFLTVPLTPALSGRRFYLATLEAGIQIKLRVEGPDLPFFIGPTFAEHHGALELWGRDPHGAAWVDVTDHRAPELFVTRGGLRGALTPPFDPKADDFYLARERAVPFYDRLPVPRDYGRGRMVQWVDLEGDGRPELYVSSKASPNSLLRFDPATQRLSEAAHALGLDFEDADAFAWLDLDGDADDDLVTLDAREGMKIWRNDGGRRFERQDSLAPGLRLVPDERDASRATDEEELFPSAGSGGKEGEEGDRQEDGTEIRRKGIDEHDLVLLDLDGDGDLDLLVSGWGFEGTCVLFLAEDGGFREATEEVGLGGRSGVTDVVVGDFDADTWSDLLFLGDDPALFHNRRGRLAREAFGPGKRACVGAVCDADGDGRLDVALAGRDLMLARNRTAGEPSWVWLRVERGGRTAVGARVQVHHADGSQRAYRIGSALRGHVSQSDGPLPLASPSENPVRRIDVCFPGGERRSAEVTGAGAMTIRLE